MRRYTEMYKDIQGYIMIYNGIRGYTMVHEYIHRFVRIYTHMRGSAKIYRDGYTKICKIYKCIQRHTRIYKDIQ